MAICRLLESSTASQQKKGCPIFSSMCMLISLNLSRIRLPLFTGVKSSRCMTDGTWWLAMLFQLVMPVALCLYPPEYPP